jgi:hypothetical protein
MIEAQQHCRELPSLSLDFREQLPGPRFVRSWHLLAPQVLAMNLARRRDSGPDLALIEG